MALETATMVRAALRVIERRLETKPHGSKKRPAMFAAANIAESTYYRYREGSFSPPVETLYKLARFVDEGLLVRVGAYTPMEANFGGNVRPDLAEIAAAMVDLSEDDRQHVVKMVQQYAALRRGEPEGGSEPERVGGSRAHRPK